MAVTQVGTPGAVVQQSGTASGGVSTVTGAWSGTQPRTADDLLVAVVTAYGVTNITAPIAESSGAWAEAVTITASTHAQTTIWTKVAVGGDANPAFTATMTGTAASERMTCFLIELTGTDFVTPVITTGTATGTTGALTVTTAGNVPATGCYAISGWNIVSASNTTTWTAGASWTNASTTGATTAVDHAMCDIFASPPSGSTLSEIGTHGVTSTFESGAIIVVQPLTSAAQPISAIFDNFNTNVENAAIWNTGSNFGVPVFTGNAVQVTTSTTVAQYSGFISLGGYILTGGSLSQQLVNAGNQALASLEIIACQIQDPSGGNVLGFYLNAGTLNAYRKVAGVTTLAGGTTYSATAHQWLKISEAGGTTSWQVSPDGVNWNAFFSLANPFSYGYLYVSGIDVGTFNIEATSTTVIMDNINIIPAVEERSVTMSTRQAVRRASLW